MIFMNLDLRKLINIHAKCRKENEREQTVYIYLSPNIHLISERKKLKGLEEYRQGEEKGGRHECWRWKNLLLEQENVSSMIIDVGEGQTC